MLLGSPRGEGHDEPFEQSEVLIVIPEKKVACEATRHAKNTTAKNSTSTGRSKGAVLWITNLVSAITAFSPANWEHWRAASHVFQEPLSQ